MCVQRARFSRLVQDEKEEEKSRVLITSIQSGQTLFLPTFLQQLNRFQDSSNIGCHAFFQLASGTTKMKAKESVSLSHIFQDRDENFLLFFLDHIFQFFNV